MIRKEKSVLITDLDNTLFDWVDIWYNSFNAMLQEIVRISGIPQNELEPEIKKIHQRHHTAEYAFLVEELEILRERDASIDVRKKYHGAIDAFRSKRREYLRLYPSVLNTLLTIKEQGTLIVGYTESMEYYSKFRIRELKLDGVLDILYCPPGHEVPDRPLATINLHGTQVLHTPRGELKPNPEILSNILASVGVDREKAVYVGDSLFKDVIMAKEVGVTDVYAEYGKAQDRPEYDLLRRVTHWTKEDVEREKRITKRKVVPTYILEYSFADLLNFFSFVPYSKTKAEHTKERIAHTIEIWKKTVDVQMHFNDLELRIRNYAITLIAALLGVSAFAIEKDLFIRIGNSTVPVAVILVVVAFIAWGAFYFMDRFWYHRLLYGSIKHGQKIEERMGLSYPEIGLTKSIGEESALPMDEFLNPLKWLRKVFTFELHSKGKMDVFYGVIAIILILTAVVLLNVLTPSPNSSSSSPSKAPAVAEQKIVQVSPSVQKTDSSKNPIARPRSRVKNPAVNRDKTQ